MGAWLATSRAEGRTVQDAYEAAVANADAEYGHQEGYSGAINSKAGGFVLVKLPPRWTVRRLMDALEEGDGGELEWLRENVQYARTKADRAKAETALKRARVKADRFAASLPADLRAHWDGLVEAFHDKWGPPLAVELRPTEAKPTRRGHRHYVFFGYAPS